MVKRKVANKKALNAVVILMSITAVILVILIAGNNSLLSLLSVYIGMLVISITIYNQKQFQPHLIGLGRKNLGRSLFFAFLLAGIFFLITRLIPGFSIGLPRVPQTIAQDLRNFIVLYFAPVIESVFQVVMYAVLRTITSVRNAILGQGALFSTAHTAAYVTGFYNYPSFTEGLSAVSANLGAFVAAFIFAIVGMFILLKPKIRNSVFLMVFHFLLNLIILATLTILFVGGVF